MVLVRLLFPLNTHQNADQKPIGSAPAYWVQCTLPPDPIYQTLLSIFRGSGLQTISFLFWSIQAQMNLVTVYFYGFCTHGTVVCITLVLQFSHCYCFASERKVTLAMLRPSCLVCQPFIVGSSLSQKRILETSTTTDSEHSGFGSTELVHCSQDHDYMTALWGWITFSGIAKETWYRIVLNFRGSKFREL